MTSLNLKDWKTIQKIVKSGNARKYFPLGHEFVTYDSERQQNITWRVVGYDHFAPVDSSVKHTMVLESKYILSDAVGNTYNKDYGYVQALYCAENEPLKAGSYCFTVRNNAFFAADNGKSFGFTLTKDVPQGGYLALTGAFNKSLEGTQIISRQSNSARAARIESVVLTESTEGTSLGNTGTATLNDITRARMKSNNYAQSRIRKWLNSNKVLSEASFEPQTKFDYYLNYEVESGFLSALPRDFVDCLVAVNLDNNTNIIYELDSLDGSSFTLGENYQTHDKMFFLSSTERSGASYTAVVGKQLEYYKDKLPADYVKTNVSGTKQTYYVRQTDKSTTYYVAVISQADGATSALLAANAQRVAPACVIG